MAEIKRLLSEKNKKYDELEDEASKNGLLLGLDGGTPEMIELEESYRKKFIKLFDMLKEFNNEE